MKQSFSFMKEFQATYEITEQDGIKLITVIIPGVGRKTTQLGELPIDFITKELANGIFSDMEARK